MNAEELGLLKDEAKEPVSLALPTAEVKQGERPVEEVPTNPGDPPINHVKFTIGWTNGGWRVGCNHSRTVISTERCCT